MLSKAGRIANIFKQGFSDVGENSARMNFARSKAQEVAHASAGNHDEYLSAVPKLTQQFAGAAPVRDYTGVKGALYNTGAGLGKVKEMGGSVVNSMGGPVGVAMTAPMALMFIPPGGGGEMEQPETEEVRYARYMQQMAMEREQTGNGVYY